MKRLGVVDAVEAHYLVLVLDAFHQAGVLRALDGPGLDADDLARTLGLSPALLAPLLDFAASRCDLLIANDETGRFRLSDGAALGFAEHMLDQYVGGYGPPLARLASLLRDPAPGPGLVDQVRHARAFDGESSGASVGEIVRLVLELGATGIVDLGCGGGGMLCDAALASPELRGLGIDANPEAVAAARRLADRRGLGERVEFVCGDALEALAARSEAARSGLQLVVASSVLNAFWASPGGVADFLRDLARLLPGRILVAVDYYSHLARGRAGDGEARTLIHDVAQLVSGQGMPPPSREGWSAAYDAAGAELLHRFEASGGGLDRFVHILMLPDRAPARAASAGRSRR